MNKVSVLITVLALIACATIALAGSTTAPATTTSSHQLADYLGTWTGKWDGQWAVKFTISGNPASGEVSVLYEWEENAGQPMRRQRKRGTLTDQGILSVPDAIEITLSDSNPDAATAVGHFRQQRTAAIGREP